MTFHNSGNTLFLGNLGELNMQPKEVIGKICGKFRHGAKKKANWVDIGSVVLVGIRDFQDNVVDIVYVYTSPEVRKLKKSGALMEDVEIKDDNEPCFDGDAENADVDFRDI